LEIFFTRWNEMVAETLNRRRCCWRHRPAAESAVATAAIAVPGATAASTERPILHKIRAQAKGACTIAKRSAAQSVNEHASAAPPPSPEGPLPFWPPPFPLSATLLTQPLTISVMIWTTCMPDESTIGSACTFGEKRTSFNGGHEIAEPSQAPCIQPAPEVPEQSKLAHPAQATGDLF
jgi:hypothetical protein